MNLGNITNVTKLLPPNGTILNGFPPEMLNLMTDLIFILKTAGIIFIVYLLFLIVGSILGIMRGIKINRMYHKVNSISDKMDLLMKKEKIKMDDKHNVVKTTKK